MHSNKKVRLFLFVDDIYIYIYTYILFMKLTNDKERGDGAR